MCCLVKLIFSLSFKILKVSLILLLSFEAWAKADFSSTFQTLLKRHGISRKDVSASVVRLNGSQNILRYFDFNAEQQRTPASLTKILTAIGAFENIPRNHQFVTEFKALKKPQLGVLKGNLYLVGSGDPSFVTEKLWMLVHDLRRLQIQRVEGDLVYDDTVFDNVRFSDTRSVYNHRAYSSPTSGLTLNWNSLWVRVFPTQLKKKSRVYLDPPDSTVQVKNLSKTSKSQTRLSVDRVTSGRKDHIAVRGKIAFDDEYSVYRSHTRPSKRAALQALNFLKAQGIEVQGQVVSGKTPRSAFQLAKSESVKIEEIIKMMMKFSNNLISEMLVKYIHHLKSKSPGNLKKGMDLLQKTLKEHTDQEFTLVNPSGLTTKNKLTADMLTNILAKMAYHPTYGPEFLASFPLSGIDGTLKERIVTTSGRVRAKTGMIKGVVGLSGYVYSLKNNTYAFTFLFNGPNKKQGRAMDLVDRLAERLALKF